MVYKVPRFIDTIPAPLLSQWSLAPPNSKKGLTLPYSPIHHSPSSATGHEEDQRTHPEKHPNRVLSSIPINAAQESPPLGGS